MKIQNIIIYEPNRGADAVSTAIHGGEAAVNVPVTCRKGNIDYADMKYSEAHLIRYCGGGPLLPVWWTGWL